MQDLATAAEQLKKALSATRARKYNVRFDGSVVQLELTRDHLQELTSEPSAGPWRSPSGRSPRRGRRASSGSTTCSWWAA